MIIPMDPPKPRPPHTWIEDELGSFVSTPPITHPLAPTEPWQRFEDIPAAVQQSIRDLRKVGQTPLEIIWLFPDMQVAWLEKILGEKIERPKKSSYTLV